MLFGNMLIWMYIVVPVIVRAQTGYCCLPTKNYYTVDWDSSVTRTDGPGSHNKRRTEHGLQDKEVSTCPSTTQPQPTNGLDETGIPITTEKEPSTVEVNDKCIDSNGSFNEDDCIEYLQHLLQTEILQESHFQQRIAGVLTTLELPLCLDHFKVVRYNPSKQLCCDGVTNRTANYERCCAGTVIDVRSEECCNDIIYKKQESTSCCGTFLFDISEQLCCGSKLYNISQDMTCCGSTPFKNSEEMCCHGNIQQLFENRDKSDSHKECCNSTNSKGACYYCEDRKQLMISFNESIQICCNGKVRQRLYGIASECCSDTLIDIRQQTCKDGKIQQNDAGKPINEKSSTESLTTDKEVDDSKVKNIVGVLGTCVFVTALVIVCYRKCLNGKKRYMLVIDSLSKSRCHKHFESNKAETTCDSDFVTSDLISNVNNQMSLPIHINAYENKTACNSTSESSDDHMPLLGLDVTTSFSELAKQDETNPGNLASNLILDSSTQTDHQSVNKRTIFGTPFDFTFMVEEANQIVQMPDSEVILRLPKSLTQNGYVELKASTFRSLGTITEKLHVPDNTRISSPVVEYFVKGTDKLQDYACITIPFVGRPDEVKVMKFHSDEGIARAANSIEIPRKDHKNVNQDCFFVIEGKTVLVYTKSFSGFYCTRCNHSREEDLELSAFVFGSYKRPSKQYEVFITVYIADDIFKFRDYGQNMFYNEETRQGRLCLRPEISLDMPDCDLDDKDYIQASLTVRTDCSSWTPVINPSDGLPVFDETENIKLAKVAQKCQSCHSLHSRKDTLRPSKQWYLCNNENTVPDDNFQCFINLAVCKRGTNIRARNCIPIDELNLISDYHIKKDSTPVQESTAATSGAGRLETIDERGVDVEAVSMSLNGTRPAETRRIKFSIICTKSATWSRNVTTKCNTRATSTPI